MNGKLKNDKQMAKIVNISANNENEEQLKKRRFKIENLAGAQESLAL